MLVDPYASAVGLFTNQPGGAFVWPMTHADRRNRIVTFAAPRLAPTDAAKTEPAATHKAVRFHRFKEVARAGRLEAATGTRTSDKRERGRDRPLIRAD